MAEETNPITARARSANYPVIALDDAIERARQVYASERRTPVVIKVILEHWGYTSLNGRTRRVLAAMSKYGLMDYSGSGDSRRGEVSARGQRILLEADGYKDDLREAALAPSIHRELWEQFGQGGFPSARALTNELIVSGKFTDDAAEKFVPQFFRTMKFAGLNKVDIIAEDNDDSSGKQDSKNDPERTDDDHDTREATVDDWVQWTSKGVAQFEKPRQIKDISDCRGWAFVEGTQTGIPVSELTLEKPPVGAPQMPPINPFAGSAVTPPTLLQDESVEENRWKLPSGRATVWLPSIMTERDFKVLRGQLDLLEMSMPNDDEVNDDD